MILVATYANRTYDPDVIELVDCWDEYSVENNYEGWKTSRQKALDAMGDDLLRWVTVDIEVPLTKIAQVLDPEVTITVGDADVMVTPSDD